MESILKSLGRTLQARRRKLKLSQAKVAELSGKTQSQIARLEHGHGDPSFTSVVEVARSLGTELVAVPIRLLPAVRNLLSSFEPEPWQRLMEDSKLVGNDPEDAEEGGADE